MKVILTGVTGMIGEGVLLDCLNNPVVTSILCVSRKPIHMNHHKVSEYIIDDFFDLTENDDRLKGFDACFFCAGISSVGVTKEVYEHITYDLTLHFAQVIQPNPSLTFIYVSGGGTDSTETSKMHWARVKGKTENDLMKLPFRNVFGMRIGFVEASKGQTRVKSYYKFFKYLSPFIKLFFPQSICTMKQLTNAMVSLSEKGYQHQIIKVKDIKALAANR